MACPRSHSLYQMGVSDSSTKSLILHCLPLSVCTAPGDVEE